MEDLTFAKISKRVGWSDNKVDFPTMKRVEFLEQNLDFSRDDLMVEILNYYRHCKLDGTIEQIAIMNKIVKLVERFTDMLLEIREK